MENQWSNISKQYSKRILTSEKILYPAVLNQLNNAKGKKIIDIGCGAGHFSNELHKLGAGVIGIDNSKEMIDTAKKLYADIDFHYLSIEDLFQLNESDFDYAIAVMLFLCLNRRSSFEKAFKQISNKLKIGGKLILIDLHPCAKRSFETEIFSQDFKESSYFESGKPIKVTLKNQEGQKVEFTDYNWTLQDFSEAIKKTNLLISDIVEIRPSQNVLKEHPELIFFSKNPIYLLIELTRYE